MDGIAIKCKDCEFWKPIDSNGFGEIDTVFIDIENGREMVGKCSELNDTLRVDIDLKTGWDGGYIEKITTTENFFCAAFEKRKCKMCKKTSEYCSCSK